MPSLPVTIRKQRMLIKAQVTQKGQVVYDERQLPTSAHTITGIGVFAQPRHYLTPAPPVFFFGALAGVPTSADTLTPGTLILAADNQPARADFTQSAGPAQYLYYAYPVQLPAPVFTYQGFTGGFIEVGSLYGQVDGVAMPFRLYRSVTPNLGATVPVTVTHP